MGLDMTYVAGDAKLTFRLTENDVAVAKILSEKEFDKQISAIFDVSDFGVETSIQKSSLYESVAHILKCIQNNEKFLPYKYQLEDTIFTKKGSHTSTSNSISGISIDGQLYLLEGGLDRCELSKLRKDENGLWQPYDTKDVRNVKVIKTDGKFVGEYSISDIRIKKKRASIKIVKHLKQLQTFLDKTNTEIVQKILC